MVQVLKLLPPDVIQLTVAAELPDTPPRSGSVAVKLIVLGLAETALKVVAIGMTMFDGATMRDFGWANSVRLAALSTTRTDIKWGKRFMWH